MLAAKVLLREIVCEAMQVLTTKDVGVRLIVDLEFSPESDIVAVFRKKNAVMQGMVFLC